MSNHSETSQVDGIDVFPPSPARSILTSNAGDSIDDPEQESNGLASRQQYSVPTSTDANGTATTVNGRLNKEIVRRQELKGRHIQMMSPGLIDLLLYLK